MYLSYLSTSPESEALLLVNERGRRVELFVLANNDSSYTLVTLSGAHEAHSSRVKSLGPYQVRDLAFAARSAIAAQLQREAYRLDGDAPLQWRIAAQRHIKQLRASRAAHTPDCRFDPKDVLFD